MSQIEITVKLLNELQPTEIVRNDNVRDKFIQIYDAMWSQSTGVSGEAAYEKEARNFNRLLSELVLRARCGQIRHADNPVIVYEEDSFEFGERNGQKFVNYTCRLPHQSGRIVACFMKITRADGSADYAVMLPEDWARLSNYSARQNSKFNYQTKQWENGKPNALYTAQGGQIDPGFLVAKCIKHAFKTYPKARVGHATQLESQQVDETETSDDIYGITDNGEQVDTATGEINTDRQPEQSFAPADNTAAGVTVNPAANDDDDTF